MGEIKESLTLPELAATPMVEGRVAELVEEKRQEYEKLMRTLQHVSGQDRLDMEEKIKHLKADVDKLCSCEIQRLEAKLTKEMIQRVDNKIDYLLKKMS